MDEAMEPDRIGGLIDRYLDGIATEAERLEMEAALRASPEAARRFARAVRMDQSLHRHYHRAHAAAAAATLIREAERAGGTPAVAEAGTLEALAAGWRRLWGRTWDHLWGPAGAIALHVVLLVLLVRWVATDLRPRRDEGVEVTLTHEEKRQFDRKPAGPPEGGAADAALARTPAMEPLRAPGEAEPLEPPDGSRGGLAVTFTDSPGAAAAAGLTALPPAYDGRRPERRGPILAATAGLPAARIEAAQSRAQAWLLSLQDPDGSWPSATAADRRVETALGALALLARAENAAGERGAALARAVQNLMSPAAAADGGRDGDPVGTALACDALAEFHLMTRVPAVHEALDATVRRLVAAQADDGLWRAPAASEGRPSGGLAPTAWSLLALRAAWMAGADRATILPSVARAAEGLDRVQNPASGLYYYPAAPGGDAHAPADTAAAVVALQAAGRGESPRVQRGLKALGSPRFPWPDGGADGDVMESWFFLATAHRNAGGGSWIRVYRDLAGSLLDRQGPEGGWNGPGRDGASAADIRLTALCTLCLAAPYAHPTARELDRLAPLAGRPTPWEGDWLQAGIRMVGCRL